MAKNILIIGQTPISTALAKKLKQDTSVEKIFIAPAVGQNDNSFEYVDIREENITELLKFVIENEITLTVPVSDKALKTDIVSFFQTNGQNIFAPTKEACNIFTNNISQKKFLYKIHAQTAKFGVFDKLQTALEWLKTANYPVVIKRCEYNSLDDRLICTTPKLAREFLDVLFSQAEQNVLIEEYTFGHNFTTYYITDGYSTLPICPVANYKFSKDGNCGLLTNGMGCYTPDYKINETVQIRLNKIADNIISSLEKKGCPYVGIFGIDCSITGEDKFYVNELKPFFQDYDCSAVLNLIENNLYNLFSDCINGIFSDEYEQIQLNNLCSVSAVVTSNTNNQIINKINGPEIVENIEFYPNCKQTDKGLYMTTKGKIFVITRKSATLNRAKTYLYEDLAELDFNKIEYRKDICL